MSQSAPPKKPSVWPVDIVKGAFLGDYAERLGVPGYATQGILGFVPIIGSCCAFRDLLANWDKRDGWGIALNAFSLMPVLGGFPKTARAIRCMKDASQAYSTAASIHQQVHSSS